ncbi:MAG: four helix bundle protein [Thermodesulfobacteriota bacterium]|nr:four helix bundle protein [Thermodesulfobacteriota bacterium]
MKYDLEDRLVEFAVSMIGTVGGGSCTQDANHVPDQFVCTRNSFRLEQTEALNTESRRDFVQKVKVSLKELNDVRVWIGIIFMKAFMGRAEKVESELSDCQELIRILATNVVTTESKKAQGVG